MSKFVRRYLVRYLRHDHLMRLEAFKRGLIYDSLEGLFYNVSDDQPYLENGKTI